MSSLSIRVSTLFKRSSLAWWWWHIPLVPELGRRRHVDPCECEISLVYRGVPGQNAKLWDNLSRKEKPNQPNQTKQKKNQCPLKFMEVSNYVPYIIKFQSKVYISNIKSHRMWMFYPKREKRELSEEILGQS